VVEDIPGKKKKIREQGKKSEARAMGFGRSRVIRRTGDASSGKREKRRIQTLWVGGDGKGENMPYVV